MSTQVFFQSPMGPLPGSRVKIRGHMIAHRTPSTPGLNQVIDRVSEWQLFFEVCGPNAALDHWIKDTVMIVYTLCYQNERSGKK